MTPEELLRPRYKVIADYPDTPFTKGQIIELTNKADKEFSYNEEYFILIPGQRCNTAYGEAYFRCYPHLFEKLEWWEERKPEDMPPYLCSSDKDRFYKVNEWCGENSHGEPLFRFFNNVNYLSTFCVIYYEPATEAEYTQYIESLKQTT